MSSWLTVTELSAGVGPRGDIVVIGHLTAAEAAHAAAAHLDTQVDRSLTGQTSHDALASLVSHVRRGGERGAVLDLSGTPQAGLRLLRSLLPSVRDGGRYLVAAGVDGLAPEWLGRLHQPGEDGARGEGLRAAMGEVSIHQGIVTIVKVGQDVEVQVDVASSVEIDGGSLLDLGLVTRLAAVRSSGSVRMSVSHDASTWIDVDLREDRPGHHVPAREVRARHLRLLGHEPAAVLARMQDTGRRPADKCIYAARGDGLGARLAAILHAVRVAGLLGLDYAIAWPDALADDPDHGIVRAEDFFTPEFWDRHGVVRAPAAAPPLAPPARSVPELLDELVGLSGWSAPWSPRVSELVQGGAELQLPYDRELDELGLRAEVRAAIDAARSVELPSDAVGLHLRSGDIVFGRYRRNPVHTGKTISVPTARAVVAEIERNAGTVVLFGQDPGIAEAVAIGSRTLRAEQVLGELGARHLQAMAEMILMSRLDRVVARRSAFAEQAASIGGRALLRPEDVVISSGKWTDGVVTPDDVAPLVGAHAAWSAYWFGRHELGSDAAVALLTEAAALDPVNPLYPLSAAAIHYDQGDHRAGDAVLRDAAPRLCEPELGDLESTLLLRTGPRYELAHVFASFERAARAGSAEAAPLVAALDADREELTRRIASPPR